MILRIRFGFVADWRWRSSDEHSGVDLSPYRMSGRESLAYRLARLLGRNQMTAFRRNRNVERERNAPFHSF